jgi:hypothetical protein
MAATTYTGTGATLAVSNAVNSVGMQPDLVWIKNRTAANSHQLADSIRGVTKYLFSDATSAEETRTDQVTAFSASGFSLSALVVNTAVNNTGNNYVGWQWKAGGTAVSNTAGTITSSVSANTTAGFSVVTYTGTGANATVGHGLGVAPSLVIVKHRNGIDGWTSWHIGLTSGSYYVTLNNPTAQAVATTAWNSTVPSATVVSLGNDTSVNTSGGTYVAYCWAPVAGYSAFGSYAGNSSADGPFIYTGFRPRWVMIKEITVGTTPWMVWDSSRDTYNPEAARLVPNTSDAEVSVSVGDFVSNGIKLRVTGTSYNATGSTYIYAAYAENPLKYANAR